MIGVQGQYLIRFNLGKKKDFLEEQDLIKFKIHEKAGNLLPTYELTFRTKDPEVEAFLNEKNVIQFTYGKDRDTLKESELSIEKWVSDEDGTEFRRYFVIGTLKKDAYIKDQNNYIRYGTAYKIIKEQAESSGFNFVTNIGASNDFQAWIKHSISPRKFINNMWMHMYVGGIPAVAITKDNKFILKDLKLAAKQAYDWRLTAGASEVRDIVPDGNPVRTVNSGFINSWVGYNKRYNIQDISTEEFDRFRYLPTPFLAMTETLNNNLTIARKGLSYFYNDNVHENYVNAYITNLTNLAYLSSVKLEVSISNQMTDISLLDVIMSKDKEINNISETSEFTSGLYIVGEILTIFTGKKVNTVVSMFRDGLNKVRN